MVVKVNIYYIDTKAKVHPKVQALVYIVALSTLRLSKKSHILSN